LINKKLMIKISTSLVITIGFIIFALNKIMWNDFFTVINSFQFIYIAPAMFFVMMMHFIHSLRWNLFLRNEVSNFKLIYFVITNVSFMINSLVPFRLGDVAKIYLAKNNVNTKISKLTSTVIIGHYFDAIFLFLFLNISLLLIKLDFREFFQSDFIYYILLLINLIIILSMIFVKQITKFLSYNLIKIPYLSKLTFLVDTLNIEINLITRNINNLILTLFLTFSYWGCLVLIFKFVSIGIGLDLSVEILILAVVLSSFAISIPVTPTSLGTFHLAVVYSMSFLMDNQALLFTYSLILHTIIMISIISYGSISFIWIQFRNSKLNI